MCLKIILSVILCFTSSSLWAQWKPQLASSAQELFGDFPGNARSKRDEAFIASIWGGALRGKIPDRFLELLFDGTRYIQLDGYFSKPLPIVTILQTKNGPRSMPRKEDIIKAPLLVFIPGIFSNVHDNSPRITVEWFSKLGYHVVILPNPWGSDFIESHFTLEINSPDLERIAIRKSLEYVTSNIIPPDVITRKELLGESLGGFLASIMFAVDSEEERPFFDGLSLFWPPLNMLNSINVLDALLDKNQKIYNKKCRFNNINPLAWFHLNNKTIFNSPDNWITKCSESMVLFSGFHRYLLESAKHLNKRDNLGLVPKKKIRTLKRTHRRSGGITYINPKFTKWRKELRFRGFIEKFSKSYENVLIPSKENHLSYWLERAYANGKNDIKIFTSEDDFINGNLKPQTYLPFYLSGPDHLLTHSWGGHVGLTHHEKFFDFLKRQFHVEGYEWCEQCLFLRP